MPKINFNTHGICAAIGTGVLCAALVATPITANLLATSERTYAAAGGGPSCSDEMFDLLGVPNDWHAWSAEVSKNALLDAANSATAMPELKSYVSNYIETKKSIDAVLTSSEYEAAINTNTPTATALGNAYKDAVRKYGGYIFDDNQGIGQYLDSAISLYESHPEETGLRDAIAAAENELQPFTDEIKSIIAATGVKVDYTRNNPRAVYTDWYDTIDKQYEVEAYWLIYHWTEALRGENTNMSDWMNEQMQSNQGRQEIFLGLFCSAKHIDPSFKVNYILGVDPFGNTNAPSTGDNTNQPSTGSDTSTSSPNKPTIESGDKNVKVSGLNISINYTLNVNIIPTNDLKLTGNDFKNSLNQAFYDINVRDNQNNIVSNVGKVEVSIKLPDNMSSKSDFVIYYVPTAANGEYLTDQAKAITGVKVSADGWLTFETDHFSVYGIVEYSKGKAPNTGVVAQHEGSAAATGIKVAIGSVAALVSAGVAVVVRRQILRKKSKQI